MSYTVVNDDGILQVRASLEGPSELRALISTLQSHLPKENPDERSTEPVCSVRDGPSAELIDATRSPGNIARAVDAATR